MKDAEYMERAIKLAARGLGHTRPNPAVGAVIVKGGKIIGEGWHKKAGGDHAEVAAIKDALRRAGCGCNGTNGTTRTNRTTRTAKSRRSCLSRRSRYFKVVRNRRNK